MFMLICAILAIYCLIQNSSVHEKFHFAVYRMVFDDTLPALVLIQDIYMILAFYTFRANTAHYLLHGCHHKHPMDGLRLVFPPAATAILCIPVLLLFFNSFCSLKFFPSKLPHFAEI